MRSAATVTLQALFGAAIVLGLAGTAAPSVAGRPHGTQALESDVKAAFIYNFAKVVEWPGGAISSTTITIDVIDDQPLAASLRRLVDGKRAQGRTIAVRGEARECATASQMCVIGGTTEGAVASQLNRLKRRPVLTISDWPRFLQLGGIIQFRVANDRLRFRINTAGAAENGLQVSGRLLALSDNPGRPQ